MLLVALAASLVIAVAGAPAVAAAGLSLALVEDGFASPLYVTNAGDARLFVVERGGRIKIVNGGTFLDLSALVSQDGGERGLLGLAFHPGYATNGLFYVDYVRAGDGASVIAEYHVSADDPHLTHAAIARIVLTGSQPY